MSPTRRDFLKASMGTAALASLGPGLGHCAQAAGRRLADDTVLVILELAGGNDGLNSIIPFENDVYGRSRPTLRLTGDQVLKINDELGFHPQLAGFRRLYDEGHLSVVQGVGYPNPNGGHDEAMLDWQSAQPHQTNRQTGWVGRAIDACDSADVPAVLFGQVKQPFCLNSQKTIVPSIHSLQDCTLRPAGSAESRPDHRRRLVEAAELSRAESDNPLLSVVQQGNRAAHAASRKIEEVIQSTSTSAGNYPRFPLARYLSTIAQLIRADTGVRIFYTGFGGDGIGGFDNHASQRDNHAALLRHLSESVAAFIDDLKRQKLLDRVVLMTFSEFGRTIQENGRKGTGHGSAAPMFLAGGKLKGGLVGEHPSLTDLENGGPKHHTDFRRVYATMLESWLGFDSQAALGGGFEPLDVFEA
ncbi:MAG: DUF1501 domain-containing protein [Thermoguttaceae bacterium]